MEEWLSKPSSTAMQSLIMPNVTPRLLIVPNRYTKLAGRALGTSYPVLYSTQLYNYRIVQLRAQLYKLNPHTARTAGISTRLPPPPHPKPPSVTTTPKPPRLPAPRLAHHPYSYCTAQLHRLNPHTARTAGILTRPRPATASETAIRNYDAETATSSRRRPRRPTRHPRADMSQDRGEGGGEGRGEPVSLVQTPPGHWLAQRPGSPSNTHSPHARYSVTWEGPARLTRLCVWVARRITAPAQCPPCYTNPYGRTY